ncbi:MAG: protein kinase [Pseudomonadota bacterium]
MVSQANHTEISNQRREIRQSLTPGTRLGKYRISRLIGRGGMAEVYLGEHDMMHGNVAIKVLLPEFAVDKDMVARFKGEARAAFELHHPNIIRIHYVDEHEGIYYFSMDYVEGRTLSDILTERGKLTENEALDITRQITRALAKAHSHNLVHRDIKPSNIMVSPTGQVVVTDFGIAKDWTRETTITQFGVALGTPRYASPEQKAAMKVDGRSDIYSLGVVMYEMVTGKTPAQAQSSANSQDLPPSPSSVEPTVSDSYSNMVLKALERRPEKRFTSADLLLQTLDRIIEGKSFHYIPTMPRQKKLMLAGGLAGLLLILSLIGWFAGGDKWVKNRLAPPSSQKAMEDTAKAEELARVAQEKALRLQKEMDDLKKKQAEAEEQRRLADQKATAPKVSPELIAKAKALVEQGEQKVDKGDFDGASAKFKEALSVAPDLMEAHSALDTLPVKKQLWEKQKELDRVTKNQPPAAGKLPSGHKGPGGVDPVKTQIDTASTLIRGGKYKEGIGFLNLALTMDPGNREAREKLEEAKRLQAEAR